MQRFRAPIRVLLIIILLLAFAMLIPTLMAYFLDEHDALRGFIVAYAALGIAGALALAVIYKSPVEPLQGKESYLAVTLAWVAAALFGAIPLYGSGIAPSFSAAFFEMMSGFTTTGATTFTAVQALPKSLLFWRSMSNWIGGMGIVVLFVALLPGFGVSAAFLVTAETVGVTKDKLTPKIKTTALILWSIYLGFSLLQALLLLLGGLSLFDAITITFSTMGAAGFSVMNSSIGSYNSLYVETVVLLFMLISGANFALYYQVIRGNLRSVSGDGEVRAYFGIWAVAALLITANLTITRSAPSFFTSLRQGAFHTASVLTTTGFATTDYQGWPPFSQLILFLLFFVGGCGGSAGGGIKVIRIVALVKLVQVQIKRRIHPRGVFQVHIGRSTFGDELLLGIASFFGVYLLTGLIGSAVISLSGADMLTSTSASFLTLGNIGIGFGALGPAGSFAIFPPWVLWFCSFLMLVGRLELFTVYVLFTKHFWKR